MAKEKTTYPLNELLALYMAYNRGQAGMPKAAKSRDVSYDGADLFDGHNLVARHVRRGKTRMVLATQYGTRWGSWGRASESLPQMLSRLATPGNGPVVMTDTSNWIAANGAVKFTPEIIAEIARYNFNIGMYLAKTFSVARVNLPFTAPGFLSYYGRELNNFSRIEARAAEILRYYTPEARKERAMERKRETERREREARRYELIRPYKRAYNDALGAYHGLTNVCVTPADIFAFFGHTPREGYVYKWLKDGRYPAHGDMQWPEIGTWAPTLDNVRACYRGYHLTNAQHLTEWGDGYGRHLYRAEGAGYCDAMREKAAYATARLVEYIGHVDIDAIRAWKVSGRAAETAAAKANLDAAKIAYDLACEGYV